MQTKFDFNEPKRFVNVTGMYPGMFNDDLYFNFEAKDVHTTDPKELDRMLEELDVAVHKYKECVKSWAAKTGH